MVGVLVGLLLFDLTMSPSPQERLQLGTIFTAIAAVAFVAGKMVSRVRGRSLAVNVALASMTSFLLGAVALVAVADRMFLSPHDLALLLVVLGFGTFTGLGFSLVVARGTTEDLGRLGEAAGRVAAGDLGVRTGVERPDEVGRLAAALDELTSRLAAADERRRGDETARREFFAAVGHDLRSPLASLRAAVEALRDGLAPDPDRYLAAMERDVASLGALVEDVFLLARLESGAVELARDPVDIAEVADETLEVVRPLAERAGVRLALEADRRVVIPAAPEAVGRVLRNLVENAVRHARSQVVVTVTAGSGDGVEVVVRDDGPGFPSEFVDRAFEGFSRGDRARSRGGDGGSGLGLAIARAYVVRLGGRIGVRPGPGGWVAFSLPGDASSGAAR